MGKEFQTAIAIEPVATPAAEQERGPIANPQQRRKPWSGKSNYQRNTVWLTKEHVER